MLDEEWEWMTPFRLEKSTAVIVAWLFGRSLGRKELERWPQGDCAFCPSIARGYSRYLGVLVDMDLTTSAAGFATLLTVPPATYSKNLGSTS